MCSLKVNIIDIYPELTPARAYAKRRPTAIRRWWLLCAKEGDSEWLRLSGGELPPAAWIPTVSVRDFQN